MGSADILGNTTSFDIIANLMNDKAVIAKLASIDNMLLKIQKDAQSTNLNVLPGGISPGVKTSISQKIITDNEGKAVGQVIVAQKSLKTAQDTTVRSSTVLLDTNKKVTSSYDQMLRKMNSLRWTFVNMAFVTAAVIVPMVSAVKAYTEFGLKIARVGAISGASTKTILDNMTKVQKGTIYTLNDVADAYVEYVKLGFDVKNSTEAMRSITMLATVGFTDLKTATALTGQIMYQFGLDTKDVGGIVNTVAAAANVSAADVETFGNSLSYVGGIASGLNMSLEDTAATLAVLTNRGLKGSRTGTNLAAALTAMASPSVKAEKYMNQLGISFFDANGNIKEMESLVADLSNALNGLTDENRFKILAQIFNVRGGRAMQALINQYRDTGSVIDDIKKKMEEMGNIEQLNSIIMNDGAARTISFWKGVSSWFSKINYQLGTTITKQERYNKGIIEGVYNYYGLDTLEGKGEKEIKAYFDKIKNLATFSDEEKAKLFSAFENDIVKVYSEKTKGALVPATAHDAIARNQEIRQRLMAESAMEVLKRYNTDMKLTSEQTAEMNKEIDDLAQSIMELNNINIDKFIDAFNTGVLSKFDNAMNDLTIQMEEYRSTLRGMGYDTQINLLEQVITATNEQTRFQDDLNKALDYHNNLLKLENMELNENKKKLDDVNSSIDKMTSRRFAGQTDADRFISQYNRYLKQQELATYGITDAQSWLNDQIHNSSNGFEDLYKSINKVTNATKNSEDSYSAWQDTVNEFIKDTLSAGNTMGLNVSDSIKKYQTLLLSTSKYSEDSSNAQADYASVLQDAYDVYYGGMADDVRFATQAHEDMVNGVNSSSASVISALGPMWKEQEKYTKKVEESQSAVDKLQQEIDSYTEVGINFDLSIANNIKSVNALGLEADATAVKIRAMYDATANVKPLTNNLNLPKENIVYGEGMSISPVDNNLPFGLNNPYSGVGMSIAPNISSPVTGGNKESTYVYNLGDIGNGMSKQEVQMCIDTSFNKIIQGTKSYG